MDPANLHLEYAKLKTEAQRRDFCIHLIDTQIIESGTAVETVKTIFGNDSFDGTDPKKNPTIIVYFGIEHQPADPKEMVQQGVLGWYLYITVSNNSHISAYYLSNFYK